VSGKIVNLLLCGAVVALWIGVNHFLCSTLESVDVFLAFVQMSNVIGNFNVAWPSGLRQFIFRAASFLDFDVDLVSFGATFFRFNHAALSLHTRLLLAGAGCVAATDWRWDFCLQSSLPFIVALCYFSPVAIRSFQDEFGIKSPVLARRVTRLFRRKSDADTNRLPESKPTIWVLRNQAVAKTLSIINILYLPISRYALSAFGCSELADGQSVLKMFPDVVCASTQHSVFFVLGCLGTVTCTPNAALWGSF
jgi:hypothetical protein